MALTAHKLQYVDFDGVVIDGVQSLGLDPNIAAVVAGGSGAPYNTHAGTRRTVPSLSAMTTDLKSFLDKVGLVGKAITTGDVLTTYWSLVAEGGQPNSAGSVHEKIVINKGVIYPEMLSVDEDTDASLSFSALATHDGTNLPVVFTASQALPATESDVDVLWGLGPITILGSQVEGIQGYTINFGNLARTRGSDGRPYAYHSSIDLHQPTIEIRVLDPRVMRTFTLLGTAQVTTPSALYLRKRALGGGPVANATAEHIKFTITKGVIVPGPARADHPADVVGTLTIHPVYTPSGTVLPIVLDTVSIIPVGL